MRHSAAHSFYTIEAEGRALVKAGHRKKRRRREISWADGGKISWADGGKMVEYGDKACYNIVLAHMILESLFLSDEV